MHAMKGNIVELFARMVWALFVILAQKYRKGVIYFKDTIRLAATTLSKIHWWLLYTYWWVKYQMKIVLVSA